MVEITLSLLNRILDDEVNGNLVVTPLGPLLVVARNKLHLVDLGQAAVVCHWKPPKGLVAPFVVSGSYLGTRGTFEVETTGESGGVSYVRLRRLS